MTKPGLLKSLLLVAGATLMLGAVPKSKLVKDTNWGAMVTQTDGGGHLLGNPDADVKLIEFMSYTCSHCADFAREGDGALRMLYVPTGKVSYEIRHLIRDPVDLTAAILTHCGDPKKFPLNHQAIMAAYPEWMDKARHTTQAQQSRWQFGTMAARFQAIASDLGFYDIMESRGYSRVQAAKCLADEATAKQIAETSRADIEKYDLKGTPTFILDGKVSDAHAWEPLRQELDAAL